MLLLMRWLLVTNIVVSFAIINMAYSVYNAKKLISSNYELPGGEVTEPSICQFQRLKAEQEDSDWVPSCRANGYFDLRQCNKAKECWCGDLLGIKMNDPKPVLEVDCNKPCFLRKTSSLFTFDKCDKNGEFQKTSTDIPDILGRLYLL